MIINRLIQELIRQLEGKLLFKKGRMLGSDGPLGYYYWAGANWACVPEAIEGREPAC
jgi:hypothetical protein